MITDYLAPLLDGPLGIIAIVVILAVSFLAATLRLSEATGMSDRAFLALFVLELLGLAGIAIAFFAGDGFLGGVLLMQRAYLWVTIGFLAIILLCGITYFIFRSRAR